MTATTTAAPMATQIAVRFEPAMPRTVPRLPSYTR